MKPYHFNRTLGAHRKLPQSTVKRALPSNESYGSKTGCNRTLATVLWVPLIGPGFRAPGKADLPGTLARHCLDLVPTFRAGYFSKSAVPAFLGNPKQHMKLQQPRNYDFGMFQFNFLGPQGDDFSTRPSLRGNSFALTTAAKLQQFRANSCEMTSQELNNRCRRSMRFCVVSWLLSFQVPSGRL